MSDTLGASGYSFGSPEDWGLTPAKHAELQAELADHIDCLQADEGIPAADEARKELGRPATRRRLAGAHLTDQVYATLNRLPTRQEWRELIFLLCCFVVIIAGDWLAGYLQRLSWNDFYPNGEIPGTCPREAALMVTAWLLQGVGRAAFFTGLLWSLWRAWHLGAGVMLARVLQLKLIHTVLVVLAALALPGVIMNWFSEDWSYTLPWPVWLTGPVIFAILVGAAIVVAAVSRGRHLAWSLGLVLCGVFLAPGGSLLLDEYLVTQPIVWSMEESPDGSSIVVPVDDPEKIADRVTRLELYNSHYPGMFESIDVAHNRYTRRESLLKPFPGIYTHRHNGFLVTKMDRFLGAATAEPTGNSRLLGPLAYPGAGFGWLALPIPLLGLVGFIGLVVIMGRRGRVEFFAYSLICLLAIVTTIYPFIYDITPEDILRLGPLGIMTAPLPAFDDLLGYLRWYDATRCMLVGGLVFSAGVPWLLTALFLRPGKSPLPGPEEPTEA